MLPNSRTKKGHDVLNQHDLFDRCLSHSAKRISEPCRPLRCQVNRLAEVVTAALLLHQLQGQ